MTRFNLTNQTKVMFFSTAECVKSLM